MLAARGVSLGLGKINLSELNQLPVADRALLGKLHKLKKKAQENKPRLVVKKHVDKKTLWAACRAVVVGAIIIALGLMMTVLGYFDKDLTTTTLFNVTSGDEMVVVDASLRYKLKSMQYIGPVLMGLGTFLLIIACVITLESRDRHAQIIQEESSEFQRTKKELVSSVTKCSLLPAEEDDQNHNKTERRVRTQETNGLLDTQKPDRPEVDSNGEMERRNVSNVLPDSRKPRRCKQAIQAEVHVPPKDEACRPGPSNRLTQSFRSLNQKLGYSSSVPQRAPQSDERLQNTGVLLSAVNFKRPRGPAPIAHFDSQLEMPLSSASCSTLGTPSWREDPKN